MERVEKFPAKKKILEQLAKIKLESAEVESRQKKAQFVLSSIDEEKLFADYTLSKLKYLEKEVLNLKEAAQLLGITEIELTRKACNFEVKVHSYDVGEMHFRRSELEYLKFINGYYEF